MAHKGGKGCSPVSASVNEPRTKRRIANILKRVSALLLIRKSSVRARRGPLLFAQLRGLGPSSCTRSGAGAHGVSLGGLYAGSAAGFESAGRRFEPGGAKRCLCRSAAWAGRRDLPEPPLSSVPVAHLRHIVTDLRANEAHRCRAKSDGAFLRRRIGKRLHAGFTL
jgi:hypothetical protein